MKKNIKLKNSLNLNKNNIFIKYINNKYKLVPFKPLNNNLGETKYFPSDFKEWNNNIYYFNSNYIKNLPVYDLNINKLLKGYFDLYLNRKNVKSRFALIKKRHFSLNKILISKAELKHTSSKVIITIYVFNRERIVLLNKLEKLIKLLLKIRNVFYMYKGILDKNFKRKIYKKLVFIKRTKLRFDINNLKFKDILLYKLSKLLSKIYKKKVEFNIINLKSFRYNSNIFTNMLKKKLVHRNASLLKAMNFVLKKVKKSKENSTLKKNILIKSNNLNFLNKNLNINTIIKNINLSETIKDLYNIEDHNNQEIIFDSIKYKNIGGIRLELKGRLTKRYRADRSLFKLKIKGILRNTDSSYKGLSSVIYRGNTNPNMEYSIDVSKRRIGAFAIKGWVSGK